MVFVISLILKDFVSQILKLYKIFSQKCPAVDASQYLYIPVGIPYTVDIEVLHTVFNGVNCFHFLCAFILTKIKL